MSTSISIFARSVLDALPAPIATELVGIPDWEVVLRAMVDSARTGLADHPVADEVWARFLAAHLRAGDVAAHLAEMHAQDVHLVLCCLAGNEVAHRRLDARLRAGALQALARIRLGAISLDDVLQSVRVKLLVGDDGEPGKLRTYGGRGPLDGWLRVTTARTTLSLLRACRPELRDADGRDPAATLVSGDDPQLAAIRARCGPIVERALEQAIRELPPPERAVLRLHLVDGLTIDDVARLYGGHRSSAARRLARARHALLEETRAIASREMGVDTGELASLAGALLSQLHLTIRRVFDSEQAAETP
jgi:RNA polymerase sigma-70 factor, ECF subfamily